MTKIHGLYPGVIKNAAFVDTCTEADLYFTIRFYQKRLQKFNNNFCYDSSELDYTVEYCISHTTRFGVDLGDQEYNQPLKLTPSYFAWYGWWNDYFHNMPIEEFKHYDFLKENNQDVSKFKPNGNWRDSLGPSLVKRNKTKKSL